MSSPVHWEWHPPSAKTRAMTSPNPKASALTAGSVLTTIRGEVDGGDSHFDLGDIFVCSTEISPSYWPICPDMVSLV